MTETPPAPSFQPHALRTPLALAQALMRAPSVTPADAGALDALAAALKTLGFRCHRFQFEEVDNLYARRGETGPNFCFAGHTDVVPPGPEDAWSSPPFDAAVKGDHLIGRGAVDMKGAIAAFVAAVARQPAAANDEIGSISFLITGDEEGPAVNGTRRLLDAVAAMGETIDHCLVGEPTSSDRVGDVIKVGRRGSLNGHVRVRGRQGHVAYPDRAENPIPPLMEMLARLLARPLDEGAPHFQPSNLEVTSIDVGNPAHNVIPGEATARFNIRFNTSHSGAKLLRWIEAERASVAIGFAGSIDVDAVVTGEAFLTPGGFFLDVLRDAVEAETGRVPAMTTGGGTSDARFIKNVAPVAELGLVGSSMHKIDERTPVADLEALTRIYERVLSIYFGRARRDEAQDGSIARGAPQDDSEMGSDAGPVAGSGSVSGSGSGSGANDSDTPTSPGAAPSSHPDGRDGTREGA